MPYVGGTLEKLVNQESRFCFWKPTRVTKKFLILFAPKDPGQSTNSRNACGMSRSLKGYNNFWPAFGLVILAYFASSSTLENTSIYRTTLLWTPPFSRV